MNIRVHIITTCPRYSIKNNVLSIWVKMLYIVHYTMLDCTLHQSTINTQHRTPQSTGSLHCTLHQSKKKVYFTVHILCTKVPYSRLNTLYNLKHLISTFHASFLYLSPSGILILSEPTTRRTSRTSSRWSFTRKVLIKIWNK